MLREPASSLHRPHPFAKLNVCRWRSSAVERLICNQRVGGSNPSASSSRRGGQRGEIELSCCRDESEVGGMRGEVAKRSNATDCKSVAPRASKVRILPSPPRARAPLATRAEAVRCQAGVAQLVELQPSKLDVAGSSPVARSTRSGGGRRAAAGHEVVEGCGSRFGLIDRKTPT